MLIFFEGHDHSGKTTIAKALAKELENSVYIKDSNSYKVIKLCQTYPICSYIGLFGSIFFEHLDPNKNIIVDRYVLSDIVYSKIFNRVTDTDINLEILKRCRDSGAIHIVCYKTDELEKDEIFDNQELVRQEFLNLRSLNDPSIFFLDTTDQNLTSQINKIKQFITEYNGSKNKF